MAVSAYYTIQNTPRQKDSMLRRQTYFFILKSFTVIAFLLVGVAWLKTKINVSVVPIDDYVKPSSEIESDPSDYVPQLNVNHLFPGVFNLMEDASWFTGVLHRPIKECSFGKFTWFN